MHLRKVASFRQVPDCQVVSLPPPSKPPLTLKGTVPTLVHVATPSLQVVVLIEQIEAPNADAERCAKRHDKKRLLNFN